MDYQHERNSLLSDSATKSLGNRPQSVRPKNWQRNQRKSAGKPSGVIGHGRIERSKKNTWKNFDSSILSNVSENSIVEQFFNKSFSKDQKFDVSEDFRNNGVVGNEFLPFKTVEPSQFNHTFPKPIGWGRKKVHLGNTVNLDNSFRAQQEQNYWGQDSCIGILHSKMDPVKRPECAFCKRNNAKDYFHVLKDELGGVVCPVLSAFTCKMCAATGRNAHTHKYCPVNPITKGDPVAAGMPPGRPLTKADKEWLQYFHTKFLLQLIDGTRDVSE